MATISFPTTVPSPSYGAAKKSKPRVNSVQFGSGYTQRVTFGFNQDLKIWSFQWKNISETHANTIEEFFEARAGVEGFNYTAPAESDSSVYICPEWEKTINYLNTATITASFVKVAEP